MWPVQRVFRILLIVMLLFWFIVFLLLKLCYARYDVSTDLNSGLSYLTRGFRVIHDESLTSGSAKSTWHSLSSFSSKFVSHHWWTPHVKGPEDPVLPTKLIYFYNRPEWFDASSLEGLFHGCEVDACRVTEDPQLMTRADAVWVVLCSLNDPPPPKRKPRQVWLGLTLESPHYCWLDPAWTSVFNWTMTYRTDSDVFNPYGQLVYRPHPPPTDYSAIYNRKTRNAAWFVSHCSTTSRRELYVQKLQQFLDVDVYGHCGHLSCEDPASCTTLLSTTYFFYLAFENSLCQDYVTEKFFSLFRDGVDVIPVVRGGADYKKLFPPGTFVDTADFHDASELATYLLQLRSDPLAYSGFLQRKAHFLLDEEKQHTPNCDLCKKLHDDHSTRHYPDLRTWWNDGTCHYATDITISSNVTTGRGGWIGEGRG